MKKPIATVMFLCNCQDSNFQFRYLYSVELIPFLESKNLKCKERIKKNLKNIFEITFPPLFPKEKCIRKHLIITVIHTHLVQNVGQPPLKYNTIRKNKHNKYSMVTAANNLYIRVQ